jgi:serine protease Do
MRGGETRRVEVAVAEMPDDRPPAAELRHAADRANIGVALAPLGPELRGRLDIPDGVQGAAIAQVRPGSAAEEAGLRPGDVVVAVGAKPVDGPAAAAAAIREALAAGDAVALRVMRDGQTRFVGVDRPRQG